MPNVIKSATTVSNGTIKRNNFLIGVNTSVDYGPTFLPGSKDTTFNIGSGFNTFVTTIEIQSDGKIIVGGIFTSFNGGSQNRLIRLNSDGSKDTSFNIGGGFNEPINSTQIQSDGKIIAGGSFTTFTGSSQNRLIRLNSDGSKDTSFDIGSGFSAGLSPCFVYSTAIQSDGKILVGGFFTTYQGVSQNHLIRLNSDGSKDTSFNIGSGFNNYVATIKIQSDGKILAGGSFTTFTGSSQNSLIRLNSDGSKDTSFNIGGGFNSDVIDIAIQSDGKILVGGVFNRFTGSTQNYLIRLNSNGSKDETFNIGSGFDSYVTAIEIQSDGKIISGGYFTTFAGISQNRLIGLNSDGSKDTSFNIGSGFNDSVDSTAIQSDGKILAGGNFTTFTGSSQNRLIRLGTNGTGFWSGIVPPTSGYTVYTQKESQGPSIRVASNDSELITIARQYGGTSITTANDALSFFNGQSQYMVTNIDYENIVTSGLTLLVDAGYVPSYPRSGTTWSDLSGNGFNCSMTPSAVNYNNTFPQYFDYANLSNYFVGNNSLASVISNAITITSWINVRDVSSRSVVFDKYQTPSLPAGYVFEVGTASGLWTNTLRFFAVGSTGDGWDPRGVSNAIQQDVPCMVSVTLNRSAQQSSLYVNGSSISYTQGGGPITNLASDWATGGNVYTLGSYRPDIAVDSNMYQYNLLIYNRALSASEILQNYNAQKSRFGL